jgi:hypothetical protein
MGLAALIVYVTLGRRRIDYRYVLAGAIVPDLVDAAVHRGSPDRGVAHSILAVVVIAVAVILVLRGEKRLAVFGIPVGWLLHLVGDGMWNAPRTFLWPAFGGDFSKSPEPYSWDLFTNPLSHVGTWGAEVAGLLILAWFWVAFGLGHDGRARLFLKDGYLRPWDGPQDRVVTDNR